MTLTNLQLAELIAEAVHDTDEKFVQAVFECRAHDALQMESGAQAVLRVMRETATVFCRVEQDEDGVINGDTPPVPLQPGLFETEAAS